MSVLVYGDRPDYFAGQLGTAIPLEIGWYFAGLVDGEGCFSIAPPRCDFILKMRADDRALLETLRADLGGVGRIGLELGRTEDRTRRPQVRWTVSRQRELVWLTEFFDAFPLRSKKARDYAIWREAVIEWANGMPPAGLAEYRDRLREVRVFA